jgi:hypothetical protein
MATNITAADYLGALPVTETQCPDDGDDVQGQDIQNPTAALLANDRVALHSTNISENNALTTPGATLHTIAAGASYAAIAGIEIIIPDCEIGDKIVIDASAIGDYTGGTNASIRFRASEDDAGTPTVFGVPNGFLWFPPGSTNRRETNVGLVHTITAAGDCRLFWEGLANATNLVLTTQVLFSARRTKNYL